MIVLLSPAKTLDFETKIKDFGEASLPYFMETTSQLIKDLKKLKEDDISKLMKLSKELSSLNYKRFQEFETTKLKRKASYAFKGDTYKGLQFETLTEKEALYANEHIFILSGLYGLLKPFDLISPYRLEMGTKLKSALGRDLYEVWREKITEHLNNLKNTTIINCASQEYFRAVDIKNIDKTIITPEFYEVKNNEAKIIGLTAKRARGAMARFIVKNKIKDIKDLPLFNEDGFIFNKKLSTENTLRFYRG